MADKLLTAALAYAARGWPIFPCKGGNGELTPSGKADKSPLTPNGVLDATTDPEKIKAMWAKHPGANIGLNVGDAGMVVLDYDPGFKKEELEKNVGAIPKTALRCLTPRGGSHEYFVLASGEVVSSPAGKLAPHCDVRSFHAYVLLPPSSTKDGSYTWESEGEPAYRSDRMVEAANLAREKHKDHDTWIIEPDLPENVARAIRWLQEEAKPAIQDHGGDLLTYATAAMCKSYGIAEGTALELMWKHWNGDCDPPWDYEELAVKVANGYSYNLRPPGHMTPAYKVAMLGFTAVEVGDGGLQITSGRFRFVDREALQAITPPEWLVPDTIPTDAYAMLVGPSGSYKTFIALDMALTVATGGGALVAGEWRGLWEPPRRPGPVLFAAGEGRAGLRKRVEAWEKLHLGGQRVRDFVLGDPVPHVTAGDVDAFVAGALEHYEGYSLVILDTVARAMQGVNTNSDENATAFTRLCDELRKHLGCSVLALHHTGYSNQERGRGSSAFLGDPDTILVAELVEDGLTRLTMAKQKDAEAWGRPLWARMEEVPLPGERKSLVATRGRPPAQVKDEAAMTVLDRFVVHYLRTYSPVELTDLGLAEALHEYKIERPGEDDETLGRSVSSLQKDFKKLRADKSPALCKGMYDPAPKKRIWRYSAVAASDFSPSTHTQDAT